MRIDRAKKGKCTRCGFGRHKWDECPNRVSTGKPKIAAVDKEKEDSPPVVAAISSSSGANS